MRKDILAGLAMRRRWTDEQKLQILAKIGINGARVADIACWHDIERQHLYRKQPFEAAYLRNCYQGTYLNVFFFATLP